MTPSAPPAAPVRFGTDGIRDTANHGALAPLRVLQFGAALGELLHRSPHVLGAAQGPRRRKNLRPRVLLGADTRASGDLLAGALSAGLQRQGVDVAWAGVLPTPALAQAAAAGGYQAGVVLSASHNPFEDNGIKVLGPAGYKIPDAAERRLERGMEHADRWPAPVVAARIGGLSDAREDVEHYAGRVRGLFGGRGRPFRGFRVVLDCANGATFRLAPRLFESLGVRVEVLNDRPDGRNINAGCGSLHPDGLMRAVRAAGADLGVAFDGDGDRAMFVDESGTLRDGDHVLAFWARDLAARDRLPHRTVVGTIMANAGLEVSLKAAGIRLRRTPVGDRFVVEAMRRGGLALGGEQSGHLIYLPHAMTGDGILTALNVLAILRRTKKTLSALASVLTKFPQVLVNVRVRSKPPLARVRGLAEAVREAERMLAGSGRVLIRYSGTEALLRIMLEGPDAEAQEAMAERLGDVARSAIGR